jgi:nucleotide-binding universal stress UspA family protein
MTMTGAPAAPYRSLLHPEALDGDVPGLLAETDERTELLCRSCARTMPRGDMPLPIKRPFTRVLICTDGSLLGNDAVALGLAMAQMAGTSVVFLHAAMPWKGGMWLARMFRAAEAAIDPGCAALAETSLDCARAMAMNAGVRFETRLAYDPDPERAIFDALRDTGCDLVVMGSRNGRRARRVASRIWVPLLTCQAAAMPASVGALA